MWNWLISSLASKSSIVLYDGSPFFPNNNYLFEIIEKEGITFFGTGAKYIDHLKQNKISIKSQYKLCSTATHSIILSIFSTTLYISDVPILTPPAFKVASDLP